MVNLGCLMWSLIPSRLARKAPPIRPTRTLFFCLVGVFFITLIPHVQQLPLWVTVAVFGGMIFRLVNEIYRWKLPSSTFCGVLAICLSAAIYFQFGTIFGRDAATAFMVALLTIKFFELRSTRDIALIIFCTSFVVMSSLLYSQDVELFVFCLVMMWVLTALLLRTSMGDTSDNRPPQLLGMAGIFFLQALPLTLILFFFFPRYHGVLQLGSDATSIGLTDKLEPGSIERLANDDSTAMTVRITNGGIVAPGTLYWRALVLWNYGNETWTPGDGALPGKTPTDALLKASGGMVITQEITIYPHFHRWLFALDYPVRLAESSDHTLGWSQALYGGALGVRSGIAPINHEERYNVASSSILTAQELGPELRRAALALPEGKDDFIDPQVKALAVQLHKGCRNEDDYIRAVLYYFRHEHFIYSVVPGAQGKNALANFLLKSRVGFCEHFASAFAVLMRLGHIPARVVVGYQGAQFNPYNSIFVVKQSNAHSWDEVWIESEKTWRRVDPTTILDARDTLAATDARTGGISISVAGNHYTLISANYVPNWMRQAMLETELRRQEVEANWNDWIFSYDPEVQTRIARALGVQHKARLYLGLFCLAATALCGAVLALAMRRRVRVSPVEDFYAEFCASMAQRGAPRSPWEAPLAYAGRVAESFPEQREVIAQAGQIVADARYGQAPNVVGHSELKSLLAAITGGLSSSPHES